MASNPNEPPATILVDTFSGLKNTVRRERLRVGELETAINVDIDDVGQISRRRGQTKVATGDFHSLIDHGGRILVVKNGTLGLIDTKYNFTSIVDVGPHPLAYVSVGTDLYFSSISVSGRIDGDLQHHEWGQIGGAGEWLSPVVVPTPYLGQISGKLLGRPPVAEHLAIYNGRIYLALKNVLWHTELWLYDKVDVTRNFYTFESDITMLQGMEDGLYVGTEGGLSFLAGAATSGLKQTVLSRASVLPGTAVSVPGDLVHPDAQSRPRRSDIGMVCMTTDGIFACFNGGEAHNLTLGKVAFPEAYSGAALFRAQDGVNSYVAVLDSEGSPATSRARIGAFVDAEIKRPIQGG